MPLIGYHPKYTYTIPYDIYNLRDLFPEGRSTQTIAHSVRDYKHRGVYYRIKESFMDIECEEDMRGIRISGILEEHGTYTRKRKRSCFSCNHYARNAAYSTREYKKRNRTFFIDIWAEMDNGVIYETGRYIKRKEIEGCPEFHLGIGGIMT